MNIQPGPEKQHSYKKKKNVIIYNSMPIYLTTIKFNNNNSNKRFK